MKIEQISNENLIRVNRTQIKRLAIKDKYYYKLLKGITKGKQLEVCVGHFNQRVCN